jgi:hypothetical protein
MRPFSRFERLDDSIGASAATASARMNPALAVFAGLR